MSGQSGVNEALLEALPAARNVLELGCATGLLGRRYKAQHPSARWHGVDVNAAAIESASAVLDRATVCDLESGSIDRLGGGYDLLVLGDVLEHLTRPQLLLENIHAVCAPDVRLFCCMPNLAHASVLERMIAGDVMYDDAGLLDRTHLRIFSPRSVFKMFLDAGWMPRAVSRYRAGHPNAAFLQALYAAAATLGLSESDAQYSLETYQLIIGAVPWDQPASGPPLNVAVVVDARSELLYSLNIARSPGLAEIGAALIPIKGAGSAEAALRFAAERSAAEWLMVAPQDLYLPKGAGFVLASNLGDGTSVAQIADTEAFVLHRSKIGAVDAPRRRIDVPHFRGTTETRP